MQHVHTFIKNVTEVHEYLTQTSHVQSALSVIDTIVRKIRLHYYVSLLCIISFWVSFKIENDLLSWTGTEKEIIAFILQS